VTRGLDPRGRPHWADLRACGHARLLLWRGAPFDQRRRPTFSSLTHCVCWWYDTMVRPMEDMLAK
jgi:hypothetical protein